MVGAISVGLVYQFYYSGGDTFAFHTHGSRHIWEAFMDSPLTGLKLLFSNGEYGPGLWDIAPKIWYWRDENSFFVIRIAAIFDLFTFSTYSATALLFSVVSFVGAWLFFTTFYRHYPDLHRWLAFSILFFPTVVLWGSGILKDTLTLAALGVATWAARSLLIDRLLNFRYAIFLLLAFWVIYQLKVYIILCFLPALLLWILVSYVTRIRSFALRLLITPAMIVLSCILAYFAIDNVIAEDSKYSLNNLANTAKITAYDIRYGWGARMGEGSGYTLGELDGSWSSMVRLAPAAVNVSLFRPYIWEVRNPLMFLSAVESLTILACVVYVLFRTRMRVIRYAVRADALFCLVFSIVFAFAVGVSTYNFGTLSRYKIPLIPFFLVGIGLCYYYWKSERKFLVFDATEY
ncbi:MAG TPA: hypothetical protein VGD40_25865 [Chryseosolibacter sp.]